MPPHILVSTYVSILSNASASIFETLLTFIDHCMVWNKTTFKLSPKLAIFTTKYCINMWGNVV